MYFLYWWSCFWDGLWGAEYGNTSYENAVLLRDAAVGTGIHVGTAMMEVSSGSEADYLITARNEFTSVTSENACKMTSVAKSWDEFDLSACADSLRFALKNDQAFRYHVLWWANTEDHQNPEWIRNSDDTAAKEAMITPYTNAVMKLFSRHSSVYSYDVLNEIIDSDGNVRAHPYADIDDFVCKVFKAARDAAPDAKLYYNDFNIASSTGWMQTKSDAVYNMIAAMVARGDDCPIDGIGIQGHLSTSVTDWTGIRTNIQRYAALGLKVQFTEIDLKCPLSGGECSISEWSESDLQTQADMYEGLLQMCLEEEACEAFVLWGFTDKYSWLDSPQDGLPWDYNIEKKIAYDSMLNTLKNFDRADAAAVARVANGIGV